MTILIRDYIDSDFNVISRMIDQFQRHVVEIAEYRLPKLFDSQEDREKYLKQLLKDSTEKNGKFYIAEIEGEIAGFLQGIIDQNTSDSLYCLTHEPGAHGWIGELYVDEKYRGQGIAKSLINKINDYFKKQGCIGVRLSVLASNSVARKVYKKIGFTERDVEMAIDF